MKYNIEPDILYEDNHLIAVNKPFGILSQKDQTNDDSLIECIKTYIKVSKNKVGDVFLGAVHRLDRPTTGAMVYCKTSKSTTRMNDLFRKQEIQKTYWALSTHKPDNPSGTLKHYLKKYSEQNIVKVVPQGVSGAKYAELNYELKLINEGVSMFEIYPKTGRSHQIRVQMASILCPLIGDRKYNKIKAYRTKHLGLHCRSLKFIHPVKKEEIKIVAPLPKDKVWQSFKTN